MTFRLFPLRLEFAARDALYFPAGKAANVLRGALGLEFRRIACHPHCPGVHRCERRTSCSYARVFEPGAVADMHSPSGLADWPRPFVFRARHLDGRTIAAGESFHFDLHVFLPDRSVIDLFIRSFERLAEEGLGPGRGRAELKQAATGLGPLTLDLAPLAEAPRRIRVDFLSPTELKQEHRIATRPEFHILFSRIRDRISTLSRLYGEELREVDYRGSNARALAVQMPECDVHRVEAERRSSRTGQTHSIGGFVGTAEYEGDLGEFLPWLAAARWTGVGRQPVWGKGEIAVTCLS